MGIFSQSIPDVPEHIQGRYYVITYNSKSGYYSLYSGKKTVTIGDNIDRLSSQYGYYRCLKDDEYWSYVSSGGIGAAASYPVCRSDTVSLVYTNYDLMTDSGEVYHYSGYSTEQNIVCSTLSSSTILTSLKNSFFPLVPLVAFAVISYIGFRKAWNFIKGGVRGA